MREEKGEEEEGEEDRGERILGGRKGIEEEKKRR